MHEPVLRARRLRALGKDEDTPDAQVYGGGAGTPTWKDVTDFGRDHLCPRKRRLFPGAGNIQPLIHLRPGGEGPRKKRCMRWRSRRSPEGKGKKH